MMKKTLLLFLFSSIGFAQEMIDIRLVNENVGSPVFNMGNSWMSTESNDAGLNAILSTYGVNNYQQAYGHPYPAYQQKTISIFGVYPPGLIADLNNYSSVIASAKVTDGSYSDAVRAQILDAGVGIPTGVNAGVIVTNDTGLNTIFQNFSVFYYTQSYPSAQPNSSLLRYYDVVCNCDKNLLKAALDGYSSVIQATENISGVFLLSNNQFQNAVASISPNPFSDRLEIQAVEAISSYSLFDLSGKSLVATKSKAELDNATASLTPGIYLLNLEFENGQQSYHKVVKK